MEAELLLGSDQPNRHTRISGHRGACLDAFPGRLKSSAVRLYATGIKRHRTIEQWSLGSRHSIQFIFIRTSDLQSSGYQQIGPSAGANSKFTTSVSEYMDTMSLVKGRHTLKFGADIRRETLDVLQPPNPAGAYIFNTTGTNKAGVANSGNAVASLLLGQVSAFTIDIQRRELRERANIAEFFFGDDWKLSNRLTANLGTRYTLNFPSHEVITRGRCSTCTRRCWISRTLHATRSAAISDPCWLGLSRERQHRSTVGVWNHLV